jgi:hypothetical protein
MGTVGQGSDEVTLVGFGSLAILNRLTMRWCDELSKMITKQHFIGFSHGGVIHVLVKY